MKRIIFILPGNERLGESILKATDSEEGKFSCRHFPDGETHIRVLNEVKNKKAFLLCSLNHPDDKIMPLFFLSKTLKSLGAESVCLIAPYLSYLRQDKVFNPGEGITSHYFASLISGFADSLITIDPHLHRIHSLSEIYSIPCQVIHASSLISSYIGKNIENPVLIGPDSESEQWVSEIAKKTDTPYLILEKTRLGDHEVRITVPQVEKYKNHTPVLVDDIISTAQTMIETILHLKKSGMRAPVCIGTHAIFADNSMEKLIDVGVKKIVTCNTIPHISNKIDVLPLIIPLIVESK